MNPLIKHFDSGILKTLSSNIDLSFSQSTKTRIFVLAKGLKKKNYIKKIKCNSSVALCDLVYDITSDAYILNCVDFMEIAIVPLSFQAKIKKISSWQVNLPIPEQIFLDFLNSDEKNILDSFIQKHSKDCSISYIQMLEKSL